MGVLVLHPPVAVLVKVVEVVLVAAIAGPSGGGSVAHSHFESPAVVGADSLMSDCVYNVTGPATYSQDVSAVGVDHLTEQLCASSDVVVWIPAAKGQLHVRADVCAKSSLEARLAVWRRDLHETSLAAAASGTWVTGRFLHGKGCKHDGVYVELCSVLLELVDVVGTWRKHVRRIELGGNELVDAHLRWRPTGAVNSAVQPVQRSVWLIGVGVGPAARRVGDGKDTPVRLAARVALIIVLGRRGGRGCRGRGSLGGCGGGRGSRCGG